MEWLEDTEALHELLCWGLIAFGVASGILLLCSDLRAPYGRCVLPLKLITQVVMASS